MVLIQEIPSTFGLVRNQANVTPGKIFILVVQIAALLFASLLLPLLIRYLFAVPFVELNEPLEFTFHTCTDQLHGVCSFPEAEVIFDERNIAFDGGYKYRFALSMDLIDIEILRATGMFLAQVEVKDDKAETLAVIKKTVRVTGAGLYGWYIWLRNWTFLPLYIVGLLGDGGVNRVVVDFPSDFRETFSRPAKFIVIQIQNRFIQVSSASLHIRANVGLSSYLINNFPVITYVILSGISFTILLSLFTLYWTSQGIQVYQKARETQISIKNKEHTS